MAAPTPEPNAGIPQRIEVPKPPQPIRPTTEAQSKISSETRARVQEKQQQIAQAREARENAEHQSAQAKARAEQQAKQKTELGTDDIKRPLPDQATEQPPSTNSIESQTLIEIAEGNIPPPAPKLQRIIYHVCKEFNLDPSKPEDMAKVQEVVKHVVGDSKLYSYIQDGSDLGKAMRLAQVDIAQVKTAYQQTFGEPLTIDSVEQIDLANMDQLAKAIVVFEDVSTSQEYIARSYDRMNNSVKARYLRMFAKNGVTEATFDAKIQDYTEKALDSFTPNGFSISTLIRFFYGHHPEQNQAELSTDEPQVLAEFRDDVSHEKALQLAVAAHAYVEEVLTNVEISGQQIKIEDITSQTYSQDQLAEAFIEKAQASGQDVEAVLGQNQQAIARQTTALTLLINHSAQADAEKIQAELTTLLAIGKALQHALTQTRQESRAAAA